MVRKEKKSKKEEMEDVRAALVSEANRIRREGGLDNKCGLKQPAMTRSPETKGTPHRG